MKLSAVKSFCFSLNSYTFYNMTILTIITKFHSINTITKKWINLCTYYTKLVSKFKMH